MDNSRRDDRDTIKRTGLPYNNTQGYLSLLQQQQQQQQQQLQLQQQQLQQRQQQIVLLQQQQQQQQNPISQQDKWVTETLHKHNYALNCIIQRTTENNKTMKRLDFMINALIETTGSDQLKELIGKYDEKMKCTICFEDEKNIVLVPCGHVFCHRCSDKFQNTCPVCLKPIEKIQKIYL